MNTPVVAVAYSEGGYIEYPPRPMTFRDAIRDIIPIIFLLDGRIWDYYVWEWRVCRSQTIRRDLSLGWHQQYCICNLPDGYLPPYYVGYLTHV